MKLDLYDKRLIVELDKDASASITNLAKRLKRSKQFVKYRMNRLEKQKIITGYNAIVDMSKLGYFTFRIYFKFSQMTEGDAEDFVQHILTNLKQVWTITRMHGKWDYAIFIGVKTIGEFHKIWDEVMLKYKPNIKTYNVAMYSPIHNFNRTFLLDEKTETIERVYGAGHKVDVSESDKRLIEAYASNIRAPATVIAKKANISPETVRKRIRDLEKKKVIVGYKIDMDPADVNYIGWRLDLQLISTVRNKELFEFCKQHKNIYQINDSIGGADFELEVIVKNRKHLIKLIDEIQTKFKDVVNNAEYFGYSTFHILKYIPD